MESSQSLELLSPDNNPYVLLTGAGFSYAFGGKLTAEIGTSIFSQPEIQRNSRIRDLLLREPQYERALDICRTETSTYQSSDCKVLELAITHTFAEMQRDLYHDKYFRGGQVGVEGLLGFLRKFGGDSRVNTVGNVFTLNHDLLLEQIWHSNSNDPVEYPGMNKSFEFSSNFPVDTKDQRRTVTFSQSKFDAGSTYYYKLHGSYNWTTGEEDSLVIMGGGKLQSIENNLLFNYYWKQFEAILSNSKKIMVIGYSFNDPHINKVIERAVQKGLKLHIWDPNALGILSQLRKSIKLEDSVEGLYTFGLSDAFFPGLAFGWSSAARQLLSNFFDQGN